MFNAVGGQSTAGKVLKATSGWNSSGNGTDAFGFSVLPAGYRDYSGKCNGEGFSTFFWSSTEYDSDHAYKMYLYYDGDDARLKADLKGSGSSVRCLQD